MSESFTRSSREGGNLTSAITQDLGRAIVTGKFSDGVVFPYEADLCKQYGVSRPVLREAVKMLTAKGLLKARPRQGTSVQPEDQWNLFDPDVLRWMMERKFTIELMVEFTEVRLAIEPRAAALAARDATDVQRTRIADAIERMRAADAGDDDALTADIAFHVAVLEASNNRFFRQFTDLAEATLRFSIRRTNAYKGVPRASAEEHKVVADAIIAGDAARASTEMYMMIESALNLLLAAGGHPQRVD
ncbi:MAG: FadR/GntR family transcriptional regulator [Sphingomonas oligoaromativorans]|jgi:DNA-binding FadR family transcriptional regulator|uniref:FadR/GntR family transcriptional regulator n=1 Tax=Sphingomonas oligoaromativorans TaxID=575322 RepID=UPI00141E554B|nr:FCD domain-containing protein [Sphingomonas oligoaromativorans]NIJ34236.1 DNA-binding FadR family transcriptional regulator [Sphingomonas oligoaromativorans]